jgi:hypothetical protein
MECTDRPTVAAFPHGFIYSSRPKQFRKELIKYKISIRPFYLSNKLLLPQNVQSAAVGKGAVCGGKCALGCVGGAKIVHWVV